MNVTVDVQGQKLRVLQNKKEFVAGSQKFVRFEFTLDEGWDNLLKFAQFRQGGVAYNQYLDDENGDEEWCIPSGRDRRGNLHHDVVWKRRRSHWYNQLCDVHN